MRMKEYEEYKKREAKALLEVEKYNTKEKIINYLSDILKNNPLYVFNVFENSASVDIKSDVYDLLKKNNVTISLVDFVNAAAENINLLINEEIKLNEQNKKLAYNA